MNDVRRIQLFGEVLFDHFPDGSRILGGAPFNVAWHLQAFRQEPRFISRIGDDPEGREIAALMDVWGMSRKDLQIDPSHATGSVKVSIEDGEPHYDISTGCAYDYVDAVLLDGQITQGILYHGTLAARNPVTRAALQSVKARHEGKILVDVNLRPPWWDRQIVLPLLHDADWVKLNEAELAELAAHESGLEAAMQSFYQQFMPDILVVTRGELGASAYDGRHFVSVAPPASSTVVDTVGAGDAFAAVLLLGLSKCWPLATTMERAQTFASALVGKRGATVCDNTFYRTFNEKWY